MWTYPTHPSGSQRERVAAQRASDRYQLCRSQAICSKPTRITMRGESFLHSSAPPYYYYPGSGASSSLTTRESSSKRGSFLGTLSCESWEIVPSLPGRSSLGHASLPLSWHGENPSAARHHCHGS